VNGTLLSLNVGRPKNVEWHGRTVYTGIWKSPVSGRRMVRRLNVDGDGQGDLNGHGGEQRAVLVYQRDSYRYWQKHFGRDQLEPGAFGENFTVEGLADDEVHIGDRYRIGEAEFEVTQPRVTCYRVGLRLGEPELPALLVAHHRPGFYLRVITEGQVQAGDQIARTRIGPHALSVADIDALLYLPDRNIEQLRAAVDIPALSPGWQQSFHELLAAAEAPAPAATPPVGAEPGWTGFRRLRVSKIVPESATVASIYLEGDRLPTPRAGQYLTVRAAGDPAPVRNYSLSSAPDAGTYRISIKREPHGLVSSYLHTQLRKGVILDVAAPRGEFVLTDAKEPILLVSAGVGATPVLAMLHELAAEQSPRDIWWIHVARDRANHAFAAEAHQLLQSLPHATEYVHYTATSGRPGAATLADLHLPTDADTYICGPEAFMTDLRGALVDLGLDGARIRTELFGARTAINPGLTDARHTPPHQPPGPPGVGPQITFARSGLTTRWSGEHGTLLELADACDVPTRWSCRTGVCHTCVTPILAGDVSYTPAPLELPGTGQALICCARPSTDVVLDL